VADCTFCSIVARQSPAHVVWEDAHAIAFMDLLPMTPGHCLVVPRRHVADVWELGDDDAAEVMQTSARVARLVRDRLRPLGLNLLSNNGRAADQSQFHFHFHVIPRYGHDRLLHPWERSFGSLDEIATVARVLRGELDLD
jgi:histidine triad (HIT) family protein